MSRRCENPAPRLVADGRGFRTPLQDCSSDSLTFLRREISALPRRPQYQRQKFRSLHEPRPKPEPHPPKSLVVTSLQVSIVAILAGFVIFNLLAWAGHWLAPDLPPLLTGVVPFGPRVLLAFALYAGTGCAAGAGVAYWMLRSCQN